MVHTIKINYVKYYISCDSHAPKRKVLKPCVAWEKGEAFENIICIFFFFLWFYKSKKDFLSKQPKQEKASKLPLPPSALFFHLVPIFPNSFTISFSFYVCPLMKMYIKNLFISGKYYLFLKFCVSFTCQNKKKINS